MHFILVACSFNSRNLLSDSITNCYDTSCISHMLQSNNNVFIEDSKPCPDVPTSHITYVNSIFLYEWICGFCVLLRQYVHFQYIVFLIPITYAISLYLFPPIPLLRAHILIFPFCGVFHLAWTGICGKEREKVAKKIEILFVFDVILENRK